jgi:hypothetical protein
MRNFSTSAVLIIVLGSGCVGTPKNPTNTSQLEKKVRDGVPIGSSRGEIEIWLDSQGIKHVFSDKPKPLPMGGVRRVYGTVYDQSGLDPETIGGTVMGYIPDTKRELGVNWSTNIYFFLGNDGKLLRAKVSEVGTGL